MFHRTHKRKKPAGIIAQKAEKETTKKTRTVRKKKKATKTRTARKTTKARTRKKTKRAAVRTPVAVRTQPVRPHIVEKEFVPQLVSAPQEQHVEWANKVNLNFLSPVTRSSVTEQPTQKQQPWFSFMRSREQKKQIRLLSKQREQQAKELHERTQEITSNMEVEEEKKPQIHEVDERIAEKEAKRKELLLQQEKREREQAQANRDLDAAAMNLAKKKKKHSGGVGGFFKSLNNLGMGKYRAQFIQNLAMMLNAGLPLIDALQTLQLEMRSRAMRKVIARIAELVESGHPLWRAMEEQYLFSPYEVALIRVGEEAGNLARNAQYLAEQQEKDHALRQKVKMAMIYPTIVFILMFVVVMGLGLFVLPNLVQVLYSLNADLPAATRAVIWITNMFSTYGTQAVPAMIGGMILLFLLAKYTPFRRVSQWFVFRIPGIGRLAREATIARFGVILGGLLEAGVPLVESIQSLEDVTHIVAYKRMYGKMAERVALGDSFAICFKDIRGSRRLIPASMQQLIVTGERSGTLSDTFKKVASIYEKKAEETAEKLPTILEPMLLLIIGGLVGTIAFAIITPIYSVVGNVGR